MRKHPGSRIQFVRGSNGYSTIDCMKLMKATWDGIKLRHARRTLMT